MNEKRWKEYQSLWDTSEGEEKTLGECLDSLLALEYPQEKIEILLALGNSTDNTQVIAERYAQSHANITISQIQVHGAAIGNNTTDGWFTVVNTTQTFDLIALQNVTALLGSMNLSAGWYTQIDYASRKRFSRSTGQNMRVKSLPRLFG
jgi:glycosyltransferase involved in cell wall biosynthesis